MGVALANLAQLTGQGLNVIFMNTSKGVNQEEEELSQREVRKEKWTKEYLQRVRGHI